MKTANASRSFGRLVWILCITGLLALSIGGCSLIHLRKETEILYNSNILVGTVTFPGVREKTPVVVAAYGKTGGERRIAHYTLSSRAGVTM